MNGSPRVHYGLDAPHSHALSRETVCAIVGLNNVLCTLSIGSTLRTWNADGEFCTEITCGRDRCVTQLSGRCPSLPSLLSVICSARPKAGIIIIIFFLFFPGQKTLIPTWRLCFCCMCACAQCTFTNDLFGRKTRFFQIVHPEGPVKKKVSITNTVRFYHLPCIGILPPNADQRQKSFLFFLWNNAKCDPRIS